MAAREWLTDARASQGLTQQEVARRAGIDRSFYTQIEVGTRNPSVDTSKRIADVLGLDWTNFFESESGESQHTA